LRPQITILIVCSIHMATQSRSKEEALKGRKWLLVDATDVPLGRLASQVAALIRGKHKVDFTPNADTGDFVVVVNAEKVKLTGNKAKDKMIRHYTEFVGGVKEISAGDLREKDAAHLVSTAVWGMLPRGPLANSLRTKLKVYSGASHPHTAQKVETFSLC
jgi:large subunit ribosomal protein L13